VKGSRQAARQILTRPPMSAILCPFPAAGIPPTLPWNLSQLRVPSISTPTLPEDRGQTRRVEPPRLHSQASASAIRARKEERHEGEQISCV
jgi:hypothetical protein